SEDHRPSVPDQLWTRPNLLPGLCFREPPSSSVPGDTETNNAARGMGVAHMREGECSPEARGFLEIRPSRHSCNWFSVLSSPRKPGRRPGGVGEARLLAGDDRLVR